MNTAFLPGDDVLVTEHRDGVPRKGGRRFRAKVTEITGIYALIAYADPAATSRKTDQFYAESGWRAWDGELRWRLMPVTAGAGGTDQ